MELNKPSHFDPHTNPASVAQRWNSWIKQFDRYILAADITNDARKTALLFNLAGEEVACIFDSLPQPTEITYTTAVKLLTEYFTPFKNVLYEIFTFRKCRQTEGESFNSFYSKLRMLAVNCEFKDLDRELIMQILIGTRSDELRNKILKDPNIKLQDVVIAGKSSELFLVQSKELSNGNSTSVDANRIGTFNRQFFSQKPNNNSASYFRKPNVCIGCGLNHYRRDCPHLQTVCNRCKKIGHLERVCNGGKPRPTEYYGKKHKFNDRQPAHEVSQEEINFEENESAQLKVHDYTLESTQYVQEINCSKIPELSTTVKINNHEVVMEVDTGAGVTIIGEQLWSKIVQKNSELQPSPWKLKDYSGKPVKVLGEAKVHVRYGKFNGFLPLIITEGNRNNLLGRNWLKSLNIEVKGVLSLDCNEPGALGKAQQDVQNLKKEFSDVFSNSLGCYKGPPIQLKIDHNQTPIHFRARPLPYALQSPVEEELDKLVKQGVLEPVQSSEWATPIVVSIKSNGKIRICGDYKATLNKAMVNDLHPIPPISQLLTKLNQGKYFAKLDLAQAYQQLHVDEKSALAQTIITHKGAFKAKRLQFGISSAPAIFQRFIESLLSGLDNVIPYFDDILVKAGTTHDLIYTLRLIFTRFRNAGITLQSEKCCLISTSVDFLGFVVSSDGIRPNPDKVKSIQETPEPSNKEQLQAFLGLLNFYHCFLPNKANVAEPLHRLLDKNVKWQWTETHKRAFSTSKKLLSSNAVLAHYDPSCHLILTCDASPYGIGCVLSQVQGNREVPIAFYSRTMNQSERRYAQVDREALSVVGGVKKFHNYLYGRHFEIRTDHKPLLGLFTVGKQTPNTLSPRMIRWSLLLNGYDFDLVYQPGSSIKNADGLSRLPCSSNTADQETNEDLNDVLYIESDEVLPITADTIAKETGKDPLLSKVVQWTLRGWPSHNSDPNLTPFISRQHSISYYKQCLLWGTRVIIPASFRHQALKLLHMGHEGIVRTKALARSYFWWPKLDEDIELMIKSCQLCQQSRHNPPRATVLPWEKTKQPWSRLHIDFAGPFQNKLFLIVVDSFSKWLEVVLVPSTDSRSTIKALRTMFATHGIPDTIVSDNGSGFNSQEFTSFTTGNGIRHILVAPYHPSSNGQAERMVQTTKDSLRRIINGDWQKRLAQFLLSSHVTPHCSTNVSPSELLYGRRIRTILDRVHPDYCTNSKEENSMFKAFDNYLHSPPRRFEENDHVFAKNYNQRGPRWIPAKVSSKTGPLSYRLITKDGVEIRRHIDQLRPRTNTNGETCNFQPLNMPRHEDLDISMTPPMLQQDIHPPSRNEASNDIPELHSPPNISESNPNTPQILHEESSSLTQPGVTSHDTTIFKSPRPVRSHRPPAYLKDYCVGGGVLCIKE